MYLRDVEQPEAVEIPLGSLGHLWRKLLRYIARLTNPAELACHGDIQGFHELDVELDVNVAVEVAPEGEEDRLVIIHVDRTAFSPGFRHLDITSLESEAERYRADVLNFALTGIPDSRFIAAVPSFARQSVFCTDDAVVERVVRGSRLLAPPGTEFLEDAFVRHVILHVRRTGERTEQVDHLLLGEFTQFSIFCSKCRKSINSASVNANYGTKSRAFSFEKNGEKMGQIRLLWGKNGEVF